MSKISHNQVKELSLHEAWDLSHPDYKVGDLTTENNKIWICHQDHIPTAGDSIWGSPTKPNQNGWTLSSGGGNFIDLEDTPTAYDTAGKGLIINDTADGLAFQNVVVSDPSLATTGNIVNNMVFCTQTEYDTCSPITDVYYLITVDPLTPPGTVTDFDATDTLNQQVIMTWTDTSGSPIPLYDLYDSTGFLVGGITTPFSHNYIGTEDFYLQAYNSEGTTVSNTDSGTGTSVAGAPSTVNDFAATDNEYDQITFTWTLATGAPAPTYNLRTSAGLVQANITPGYVLAITGTDTYYIETINTGGTTISNTNSGTGVIVVTAITDFDATDTLGAHVTVTFTEL